MKNRQKNVGFFREMKDEDKKISRKRVFTFVYKSKLIFNVQITNNENEKISRKSVCSL